MDEIFYTIFFLAAIVGLYGFFFRTILLARDNEKRQNILGWIGMSLATTLFFSLFLFWIWREPSTWGLFPAFLVISLVGGLLFRTSLISPYKLAKFWGKLANKNKKNRGQHVSD